MEHPLITRVNRTGYVTEQPEHVGVDFYGKEILDGDDVVEYDSEIILKDNLERFLAEELGFTFKSA